MTHTLTLILVGLLLAVTTEGHALIWSRNEDKNQWNLINYINAEGPVDSISVR